jgi:hypothetical protein
MALGYAAMGLLLGSMVLWLYVQYRVLRREEVELDRLEAEEKRERAASAVLRGEDATIPARSGVVSSQQ